MGYNIDSDFIDVTAGEINIDELKNQLDVYQGEASKQLVELNNGSSITKEILANVYSGINEKYGLELKSEDSRTYLENLIQMSPEQRKAQELVDKDMISAVAAHSQAQVAAGLAIMLEKLIVLSVKEVQSSHELSQETVGITEKMMQWLTTLGELKDKYQVPDINKSLKNVSGQSSDPTKVMNPELVNLLMQSLNNK